MLVLVGCEESQAVAKAFRSYGHEAYSCDLQSCSGGHPEYHFKIDVLTVIRGGMFITESGKLINIKKWDLIILHPPCTYTALSGNRHYYNSPLRIEGANFTKDVFELAKSVCKNVALEQPKTIVQDYIGKKSQAIQPWQFGHGETKDTWLWLVGLPNLLPMDIVEERKNIIHGRSALKGPGSSKDRKKNRSKTYTGIAEAMALQWGEPDLFKVLY